ncbi:MAG TPA: hypothetical protein VKY74_16130 [Chloroflexia bacterium]|nr:hypothetical protein [Chloroflexia bacterium]
MLIRFVIYGLLGWCMEIVWTALPKRRPIDWRLSGNSYLWMFPLYGLVAPLYEPVHTALRDAGIIWPVRGLIYAAGIMGLEVLTGWLLQRLTGRCPWDYTPHARWHWHGYTRFDYAPLWFGVGLALEPLHDFLVRLTPAIQAALVP